MPAAENGVFIKHAILSRHSLLNVDQATLFDRLIRASQHQQQQQGLLSLQRFSPLFIASTRPVTRRGLPVSIGREDRKNCRLEVEVSMVRW